MWAGPSGTRVPPLRAGAQKALPRRASVSQEHSTTSDMHSGTELKQVVNPDSFSVPELKGVDANTGGQIGNGKVPRTQHGSGGEPPAAIRMAMRDVELRNTQSRAETQRADGSAHARHGSRGESADVEAKPVPPKTTLDWIVMVIVIAGIVTFAAFQISESVRAHQNPSSTSSVRNVSRLFPGLMICPFSYDNIRQYPVNACPKWSPQATLSFEASNGFFLKNTNLDPESNRQSGCENSIQSFSQKSLDSGLFLQTNNVQNLVTVKNRGVRKLPICRDPSRGDGVVNDILTTFCRQNGIPDTCDGWTPPNVKCVVLDPLRVDAEISTQAIPNPYFPKKTECNPMKEIHANTLDSLTIDDGDSFGTFNAGTNGKAASFFSYSGLEKFWFVPESFACNFPGTSVCPIKRPKIDNVPSQGKMSTYELSQRVKSMETPPRNSADDPIFSIYGGLVAVFYDASKGIPEELDFQRAQDGAMSNKVLGSTVLLSTDCGVSSCNFLTIRQPQTVTVTTHVDELLTNALQNRDLQNSTKMAILIENSVIRNPAPKVEGGQSGYQAFQLQIRFSSSLSTVTTQYVSLSVLTTVSIIVSTAGTLWGSQEKIKAAIALVKAKLCPPPPPRDATAPHPHFSLADA
jgi:hypothetical protein